MTKAGHATPTAAAERRTGYARTEPTGEAHASFRPKGYRRCGKSAVSPRAAPPRLSRQHDRQCLADTDAMTPNKTEKLMRVEESCPDRVLGAVLAFVLPWLGAEARAPPMAPRIRSTCVGRPPKPVNAQFSVG